MRRRPPTSPTARNRHPFPPTKTPDAHPRRLPRPFLLQPTPVPANRPPLFPRRQRRDPPPPPTVPGRVGTPSVSAVSGSYSQLRVRWSRPYSGRASITGYQVRYYDPAPPAQWFSVNTTSRDYTIGGLEGGTSYSVQVRAKNRVGWGSWSRSGSARVNVRPTPEPTATDTPTPVPDTPTPEPTATDTPVPDPTATDTPVPESTPELEPTSEATPETTPTPVPAPTPEPANRPNAPYQVEWRWKTQGTYAKSSINLTWRNHDTATHYRIAERHKVAESDDWSTWSHLTVGDASGTAIRDGLIRYIPGQAGLSGIKCGSTEYGIQVTDDEYNSNEQTLEEFAQGAVWSELAIADPTDPGSSITRACSPPPAPTNFKAKATSESTINLTWNPSSNISLYKLVWWNVATPSLRNFKTYQPGNSADEMTYLECNESYAFKLQAKGDSKTYSGTWSAFSVTDDDEDNMTPDCIGLSGSIKYTDFDLDLTHWLGAMSPVAGFNIGGKASATLNWERTGYEGGIQHIRVTSADVNVRIDYPRSLEGLDPPPDQDIINELRRAIAGGTVVRRLDTGFKKGGTPISPVTWCASGCTCRGNAPVIVKRQVFSESHLTQLKWPVTEIAKIMMGVRAKLDGAVYGLTVERGDDLYEAEVTTVTTKRALEIKPGLLYGELVSAPAEVCNGPTESTPTPTPGTTPTPAPAATPTPAPESTPTPAAATPTPAPVSTPTPAPNQAPTFASNSYNASASESLGTYSIILEMARFVSDPDVGDTLTYYITSGNSAGKFSIDYYEGFIVIAKKLDYDVASSYSLTVEVRDGNGGKASVPVTITVLESS